MIIVADDDEGYGAALVEALARAGRGAVLLAGVDVAVMRAVRDAVLAARPSVVVWRPSHADVAAVDGRPEAAAAISEAAIHFAAAAREARARLVAWSSGWVFGARGAPRDEADEARPEGAYGDALLRAERFATRAHPDTIILRTAPLVARAASGHAPRWLRALDARRGAAPVIHADDVAAAVAALVDDGARGVFHLSGEDPIDASAVRARLGLEPSVPRADAAPGGASNPRPGAAGPAPLLFGKIRRYLPALRPWSEGLGADAQGLRALDEVPPTTTGEVKMGQRHPVRRVEKPWGHEIIWAHAERYVGKLLFIKAGERLSLQYHEQKDETVYVLSGKMVFEHGPRDAAREDLVMKPGDAFRITPHTVHRMIALEDTQILEASTPELDDVVRLEDKYGRQGTSAP
jgi:mannose-6-phosphate isomerase